jgi:HK97 family phage prohead protease
MNKGAFHRTLRQKADVRMLKNHNSDFVFARTKSGTLELSDDPHLRASAPSLDPSNPQVQTLRSELARGDVDQMSIGFRVKDDEWSSDYTERTIKEIELIEVSVVTFPASPTTSAGLRSLDDLMVMLQDFDNIDEGQIRRAIAVLTEQLPHPEIDPILARDIADRDRLARILAGRPAVSV